MIGGAAENAGAAADVGTEGGVGVQEGVGIAFFDLPGEEAVGPIVFYPGGEILRDLGIAKVVREAIIVVLRVNRDGEVELAMIVQTEHLVGL
jgi:hypothetical protein